MTPRFGKLNISLRKTHCEEIERSESDEAIPNISLGIVKPATQVRNGYEQ
jgi:hypothetical protein